MEAIKESDDLNKWLKECKDLIEKYKLPDTIKFAWWWYYAEGFTPRQTIADYQWLSKRNRPTKQL